MASQSDIEEATAAMYKANLIKNEQRNMLPLLRPGEVIFCQSGQMAKKRYFFLPRTMYWKMGYNFYRIWDSHDGNWVNIKDDKHLVLEEFKKEMNELKEKDKAEKLIKQQEAAMRKQEDLERKLKEEEEITRKKLEMEFKMKEEREKYKASHRQKRKVLNKKEVIDNNEDELLQEVKILENAVKEDQVWEEEKLEEW